MTLVNRTTDCGNSPKNLAAEALAIGLEGGDWADDLLDDASVWRKSDGTTVNGATAIAAASRMDRDTITIHRVATHGKAGAVSGSTDGESFAHILTYTTASAKRIALIDSFRKTENSDG